jgi:hypothetical protein
LEVDRGRGRQGRSDESGLDRAFDLIWVLGVRRSEDGAMDCAQMGGLDSKSLVVDRRHGVVAGRRGGAEAAVVESEALHELDELPWRCSEGGRVGWGGTIQIAPQGEDREQQAVLEIVGGGFL